MDSIDGIKTEPLSGPWNTEAVHGEHRGIPIDIHDIEIEGNRITIGTCSDPTCIVTFYFRWVDKAWEVMPDRLF